jgi:hypothetical protein
MTPQAFLNAFLARVSGAEVRRDPQTGNAESFLGGFNVQ